MKKLTYFSSLEKEQEEQAQAPMEALEPHMLLNNGRKLCLCHFACL